MPSLLGPWETISCSHTRLSGVCFSYSVEWKASNISLVTSLVGPGIAFLVTGLRLLYRRKRHHLGWDDLWAAFSTLCLAIATCGAWLLSDEPGRVILQVPVFTCCSEYASRRWPFKRTSVLESHWVLHGGCFCNLCDLVGFICRC